MKKKIIFFISVVVLLIVWVVCDFFAAVNTKTPVLQDLSPLFDKSTFTEADYQLIFKQTGLGRGAVDALQKEEDFAKELMAFQAQKQEPLHYKQTFLFFPTTTAELLKDEQNHERYLKLPPLKAGDILITKSTKTLLYRHGHAGLVLEPNRSTIESLMIGSPSERLSIDNWLSYPTLLVLRPKDMTEEDCRKVTEYARTHLLGVPYDLLTGIVKKDKSELKSIDGTQCAHLIWQAYYKAGLDLDADKGWLVTPYDIAKSPDLEIVFSYGFGEEGTW